MTPQQQVALDDAVDLLDACRDFSDSRLLVLQAGAADEDASISLGSLRLLVLLAMAPRSLSVRQDIGIVEAGSRVVGMRIDQAR